VNFDRLLERRETIQSIRQRDGMTFIRFYEYDASGIRFHMLRVWNQEGVPRHRLESVRLHPLRHKMLVDALSGAGFVDIRPYGGISLEEFRPGESKDLVLTARRPG
jgi:hypothetical protein